MTGESLTPRVEWLGFVGHSRDEWLGEGVTEGKSLIPMTLVYNNLFDKSQIHIFVGISSCYISGNNNSTLSESQLQQLTPGPVVCKHTLIVEIQHLIFHFTSWSHTGSYYSFLDLSLESFVLCMLWWLYSRWEFSSTHYWYWELHTLLPSPFSRYTHWKLFLGILPILLRFFLVKPL